MGIVKPIDEMLKEADGQPKQNMIWKGIKEGTLNFVVAPPKVGKTTCCENLGISIAAGQPSFLGDAIWFGNNQRVMMISLEEFYLNRTERNRKQVKYMDAVAGNSDWHHNFMVGDNSTPRYFESKKDWDWMEAEIKAVTPRLVIMDSLTRLHFGQTIEDSTISMDVTKKLRSLVDNTGTTLIVIHHTHKLSNELLTLGNMAGSRVLSQEADAIIGLNKTPSGIRYIKPLAYRYVDDYCEKVQTFSINDHSWLEPGSSVYESSILRELDNRTNNTNKEQVLDYIQEFTEGNNSLTVETKNLVAEFVTTKLMSNVTLQDCLKKLVSEGVLQKQKHGQYTLKQQEPILA